MFGHDDGLTATEDPPRMAVGRQTANWTSRL